MQRLAIIARASSSTNCRLLRAAAGIGLDASVLAPEEAGRRLGAGDVALVRLDVRSTLDGPEPGLELLGGLESESVVVLNPAGALLAAHDKLMTALKLSAAGLPHPRTAHVGTGSRTKLEFPVVVKPRFGSWGRDVVLCRSSAELERCLREIRRKQWFRRQGALVQELVEPRGYDLRVLVAAGQVVGAVRRVAARGEWRTNIALGGSRSSAALSPEACLLAVRTAAAVGMDLVGVDLLPDGDGGWIVLEANGAVDFTSDYSLGGGDVFARILRVLVGSARSNGFRPVSRPLAVAALI